MVMVNRMKKAWFLSVFFGLGILLVITGSPYAQKQPKSLTILFTNNINGEIDPCPT